MLRKSLHIETLPVNLLPWHKKKCRWIANTVIIQCLFVFVGSATIQQCLWSPENSTYDSAKLVRIMYLYDYKACGYELKTTSSLSNLLLPNETYGLQVLPIKWQRAIVTVSTRLSSKTRVYTESSIYVHTIWMMVAIFMNIIIIRKSHRRQLLKFSLLVFFYSSICVIVFDMSMAFVYIAHIQQSVTNGMVLRYSGWNVEIGLQNYDDFAGWIPMAASVLWMRGIFIMAWNIYCCRFINSVLKKIRKREVKRRILVDGYRPIPEPQIKRQNDKSVLYYRRGEHRPAKDGMLSSVFYN